MLQRSHACAGSLAGLGPGVRTVADPQLVQQRDQLASEVSALQARLAALQASQAAAAAAADLQAGAVQAARQQLADAEVQLQAKGAEVGTGAPEAACMQRGHQQVLSNTTATAAAAATSAQVQVLEEQLGAKLLGSSQFQQMRRLMQEKAREVLALRQQLAKYEPPDIPSADGEAVC